MWLLGDIQGSDTSFDENTYYYLFAQLGSRHVLYSTKGNVYLFTEKMAVLLLLSFYCLL